MDRIFDIMNEVESNVKKLKLQMKRFDRHKILSTELNAADYIYHKKTINDLEKKIQPLQISLDEKTKYKQNFDKDLKKREKDLDSVQKKFEKTRIERESIQEEIKKIEELIIKNNQDIIISTEQIGHSRNRVDHFNNEIIVKKDQIKSIETDIGVMNKLIKEIMPEFKKRKNEYDEILSKSIKLEEKLSLLNNKREENKLKLNDTSGKINADSNMIDSNNRLITEKKNLIDRIKKDMELNLKTHNNAKEELDTLIKELKVSEKLKIKHERESLILNKKANEIQESLRLKIYESEKLKTNIIDITNRIEFYNKVLISKDGLINGNKFLNDNISKYPGVLGKVSDMIISSDKFMRAISVALGEYSDYIIVDTLNNAMEIINKLNKKNMSFNVIALDQIKSNKISITDSHLLSNIKYDKIFSNLFYLLLGNFILSDSFELKRDRENTYITLSGDMLSNSGLVKINSNTHSSKMSVNLEINNLKKELKKIKDVLIVKNEKQILEIKKKEKELEKDIEKKIMDKETIFTIINDLRIDIEQKKFISSENYNQTRAIQVNISKTEKEILDLGLKNKTLSNLFKVNSKLMQEQEKEKNTILKSIHQLEKDLLSIRQNIQEKNINLLEISNKKSSLSKRVSDQRENADKVKSDIDRYDNEIKKLNALIKQLELSKNKYQINLKKLHVNEKNINKIKNKLEDKYSSEYEKFQTYQVDIKDKRTIRESSVEDINKFIVNIEKMKSEKEFYKLALDDIKIDLNDKECLDKIEKLSLEELSLIIEKNRKSIDRIGPVNMEVGEQHKAEIERYEFLENQYNDLVESKKSLEETIKKLDSEARKRFEDTFEKIKLNFIKTYNMFYEKGKASLELKGDDILDAEIVIKATPPGKSTQSLRMLSGGEKAITAIALLFAIYLVKPSPFCILDEVDAPLDDLNIKRFNSVIKEFSKNSQFIIVTHNKLTMEGSDYLYGVTQPKEGISKIVSVNLKDVEEKILA